MKEDPFQGRAGDARIVFMGTPALSAVILEGLLVGGWNIVSVVTQPDRSRGRGRKVTPSPVKQVAMDNGIPLLQPRAVKDPAFLLELEGLRPDLILTVAYGKILSARILALPPLGCFNVHFSLLPAYRGPAPVAWAVLNGETETGVTIFRMEKGTDTGDIVATGTLAVGPDETAGELMERLISLAREILPSALLDLIQGRATFVKQDPEKATYAPLLKKADGLVSWDHPAGRIRQLILGLDPWPGAFTFWHGRRVRLWDAHVEEDAAEGKPGEILSVSDDGLRVKTGKGLLCVRCLQMEGKRKMEIADFLRGHRIEAGERFDQTP